MAKRARRLQTEEVLEMLYETTTDMRCSDYSSDSGPGDGETKMVGSDYCTDLHVSHGRYYAPNFIIHKGGHLQNLPSLM